MSTPSRSRSFELKSLEDMAQLRALVGELRMAGKDATITVEYGPRRRTNTQNNSLHLWLELLANALNDAGLEMRLILEAAELEELDVPWTQASAKEILWRPVQKAHTTESSSTRVSTSDPHVICQTLTRFLADRFNFTAPPWPDRYGSPY